MDEQKVLKVVEELTFEYSPGEQLSLSGVWNDYVLNKGKEPPEQDVGKLGSRFGWAAPGLPLFVSVIIPLALWTAKRIGEKVADEGIKEIIEEVRNWLGIKRKTATVTLTDEQIDQIANRLVQRLRDVEQPPSASQNQRKT